MELSRDQVLAALAELRASGGVTDQDIDATKPPSVKPPTKPNGRPKKTDTRIQILTGWILCKDIIPRNELRNELADALHIDKSVVGKHIAWLNKQVNSGRLRVGFIGNQIAILRPHQYRRQLARFRHKQEPINDDDVTYYVIKE